LAPSALDRRRRHVRGARDLLLHQFIVDGVAAVDRKHDDDDPEGDEHTTRDQAATRRELISVTPPLVPWDGAIQPGSKWVIPSLRGWGHSGTTDLGDASPYVASALALSWSYSAWVIAPESKSSLPLAISSVGPDVATDRT